MEEMLGNVAGARQVFERWMAFEPDHQGWNAYIKVWSVGVWSVGVGVNQQGKSGLLTSPHTFLHIFFQNDLLAV